MIQQIFILLLSFVITQNPVTDWDKFEKNVRDQKIKKTDVKQQFLKIYSELFLLENVKKVNYSEKWTFPVEGASMNDVGKSGFVPKGYDFYDGNAHGGHAAYDIFIPDRNQDCIHDKTKKYVQVLAPVDMIILSQNTEWKEGSVIRGGKYIWAFNPKEGLFFYFAHLESIYVKNGEYCQKGTPLGTIGRTGKNAFPKRSPTHLHFTVLKVNRDNLLPYDYLKNL